MQPWNAVQYPPPMMPWLFSLPPQLLRVDPPPPEPTPLQAAAPQRLYSIEEITPLIKVIVREMYEAEAASALEFMNEEDDDDDETEPSVTLEQLRTNTTISVIEKPEPDSICAVCHEEFAKGSIARKLRCNHEFHMYCIDRVLENALTCPMCRMDVVPEEEDEDDDDVDD